MEKVQYIKAEFPTDHDSVKKTDDEGNESYYFPNSDREIRALDEDLETIMACLFEPFEIIEKALCDHNNIAYANSLTLIRQNINNTLHEIFRLIGQNIGTIEITRIYELEIGSIYRWGQCVGAKLCPPDPSDFFPEGPVFDHNPQLIDDMKKIPLDKLADIETILRILAAGDSISWRKVSKAEALKDARKEK